MLAVERKGRKRSETVGNRSETVYSGRKLSETVGKTVGKGRKRSEKVWKSLNLDSILSEKSGNNPETIQKKSGKNPVLEFSHILLFQVFLGPFPDLSRFFPGFIQKIGKDWKNCRKRSEKLSEKVGKSRKRSEKVKKRRKRSDFSFGQKYCKQSWNPQYSMNSCDFTTGNIHRE